MSKASVLDEPADINAEKGTMVWARGVALKIKFVASQLNFDVSNVHGWIEIAIENEVWKILGYISLDAFLVKEAGITQSFIDAIRNAKKGTTVGDIARARGIPLSKHGENQHSIEERGHNNVISSDRQGNATEYTLRRLARDCPEMLDRIEAGELSVNSAAIAAGIRKKPSQAEICVKAFRKAENRLEALKVIVSELEPYEAATARDWILERLH